MDAFQHYPTPEALAQRAWDKFEDKHISRLLEPHAGGGDLVLPRLYRNQPSWHHGRRPEFTWDAIELDPRHHARLRELGATIVGHDFMHHTSCAMYSHILMNPPFAVGAEHVMHAWNTLFCGEIVAIINAETLRNPCTRIRELLARVIDAHGSVEFITGAFQGEGVQREADVEIALVHLIKRVDADQILGNATQGLKRDETDTNARPWEAPTELALPEGFVEATVRNFDVAVQAAREAAVATARAEHYSRRLGMTLEMMQSKDVGVQSKSAATAAAQANNTAGAARSEFASQYDALKSAAWAQVLRSTHVLSRLSSAAQKRLENEFELIKGLEFTARNVHGFLLGLVQSAQDIQEGMVLDVFDLITRYHSDNTVYYMGWKSNDLHRTAGMRIKRTRFIIPGHTSHAHQSQADWETRRMLGDFDKVFAMLDANASPPGLSLEQLFSHPAEFKKLQQGERCASRYFEVRHYPQRGTIHFFAKDVALIDRFNRLVGRLRQWLPQEPSQASADFERQYQMAEKFDVEVRTAFAKAQRANSRGLYRADPGYLSSGDKGNREAAHEIMFEALQEVLDAKGIHPFAKLENAVAPDTLALPGPVARAA